MEEVRTQIANDEATERVATGSKRKRVELWKLRSQHRVEAGTTGAPLKAKDDTHGQVPAFHHPVFTTVLIG